MNDSPTTGERQAALAVLRTLRDAGHEAYFAGGSVRDDIMGVSPKDFDVTTSAIPEEVTGLFDRCVEVGAQFGVILVLHEGHEIEISTFRTESGYADGRRPDQVTWTTAREDVLRRDFTINGLLGDPFADDPQGRVIDHVGGGADIEARLIRAIGEPTTRFAEDQLRLLRAVRFAARLDFTIEEDTWFAIRALADTITNVSAERTRDELQRLLTEGGARRGWRLLRDSSLLDIVLPEPPASDAVLERLEDAPMTAEQGWTVVLLDVRPSAQTIDAWGKRLRIPKALTRHVRAAIDMADALRRYDTLSQAQRKRLIRRPEFATAHWAASRALAAVQRPGAPLQAAEADVARWTQADLHPPPLIDGSTLRAHGHTPGPGFKAALEAVEDAQLEGHITDEAEAIAIATEALHTT